MTYLVLQTLPIVSAVALVFCLMGVFFGASKYRTQLKQAEAARESLAGELSDMRRGQAALSGELKAARSELRRLNSSKANPRRSQDGRQPEPPAPASSEPGAASSESAGPVDLGQIYDTRPELVDDLKKVRGIARVMEQKLNDAGIYTYAQIARWSDAAASEFGMRLAIAGNVERYNWREQCAKLHGEKYHETV